MKSCFFLAGLLAAIMAAGPGCDSVQMDTRVQEDPNANQVVTGTVEVGDGVELPPDAVVSVQVQDVAHQGYRDENALALGNPNAPKPVTMPPQTIGEVRIEHPKGPSIPFTLKFTATDQQMAGGLVLSARVSYGGKVRFFNVDSYAINSSNISSPRRIYVNGVR